MSKTLTLPQFKRDWEPSCTAEMSDSGDDMYGDAGGSDEDQYDFSDGDEDEPEEDDPRVEIEVRGCCAKLSLLQTRPVSV